MMRYRQFDRPILVAVVSIWSCALLLFAFTLHGQRAKSAPAPDGGTLERMVTAPPPSSAAIAPGAKPTATSPSLATATMPAVATTTPAVPAASAPSPSDAPGGGLPPLPQLVGRVDAAVAALRSAQVAVVIDYGGASATVQAQCQLNDARRVQALQLATVYRAATGGRADERILIGAQVWERRATGWAEATTDDGLREQFLAYLPNPGAGAELRYYDPASDTDTILTLDPATGRPSTMRQQARRSGTVTIVTYTGWDTVVQIVPPPLGVPPQE